MSALGRLKNRWCSFLESAGKPSKAALLIVAPRFSGQPQGWFAFLRRATYKS